jgi:hypothetical protein
MLIWSFMSRQSVYQSLSVSRSYSMSGRFLAGGKRYDVTVIFVQSVPRSRCTNVLYTSTPEPTNLSAQQKGLHMEGETNGMPGSSTKPKRNINERRAYAAHRAVMAIDRAIRLTSTGPFADSEQALCWMRLWMAFAASRTPNKPTNATGKAA